MKKQQKSGKKFEDLVAIMEKLHGPGGCPWDKKQTHQSLLPYLFSEAREVKAAVRKKDWENLEEELGDVLLQVIFHSQLAAEKNLFTITDVIRGISEKLVRRHPHVFSGKKLKTPAQVVKQWAEIKKLEKENKRKKKLS
jgi:tetrapyrrole methylase family protein/MazG family protein